VPVDLKKKYGPLSAVGWGGVILGLGVVYYLYRRYEADAATNAANAANTLTGGSTIPAGEEAVTSTSGSTPVWSSFQQWEQALLSAVTSAAPATYSATDALNDITDWLNGSCVSQEGYSAIGTALNNPSIGLPPGYGTNLPALSVCSTGSTTTTSTGTGSSSGSSSSGSTGTTPTTTTPAPVVSNSPGNPPNLPAAIAAAMTQAGEVLGGAPVWDAAYGEWLFFTNKGGIYNISPSGAAGPVFNGSYEGLPAADKGPGPTGSTSRTFTGLSVNPDGSYTLTDQWGENYTFAPGTPQVGKAA
jgi:hypothetical protein